ncbi:MAG: segregation/condensation protein A [Candidatus Atribacteria bacterium]|nr:segregation/condensation protein A [Candidatus Atribacteria bacterium]
MSNNNSTVFKLEQMSSHAQSLYQKARDGDIEANSVSLLKIIEEYLSYLLRANFESINLEIVANFLIALSELIFWKSNLLLPCSLEHDVGEVENDANYLKKDYWIEYKKYQALVEILVEKEFKQKEIYFPRLDSSQSLDEPPTENDYTELILAFEEILSRNKNHDTTNYRHNKDNIRKKMEEIEEIFLRTKNKLTFSQIIPKDGSRMEIIIIFLALLHLICQNRVDYCQSQNFAEIVFYRKEDEKLKKKIIQ